MKLASLRGGRDGRLVVVSRDLRRMLPAAPIAATLQAALDDWERCLPGLGELARRVESGAGEPFDEMACAAPLPRAYQWADGSAYVNHVALVRRARGAELPASFWTDPLIYQGGSDAFLGPRDPIEMDDEAWGIDFEAEVAVITGDVPQGADAARAARAGLAVSTPPPPRRRFPPVASACYQRRSWKRPRGRSLSSSLTCKDRPRSGSTALPSCARP